MGLDLKQRLLKNKKLERLLKNDKLVGAVVVLVVALIGISTLLLTRAAGQGATIEVEDGNISGNACVQPDDTASGGSAVQFGCDALLWSNPATWGGNVPKAGDNVVIQAGKKVILDTDTPKLGSLSINGELDFSPSKSTTLNTGGNVIVNGKLVMRPSGPTINQTLQFQDIDESKFEGDTMDPVSTDVGLWMVGSGQLLAQGTPKTSWLTTNGSVAGGAKSFTGSSTPSGWRPNDDISISPTENIKTGPTYYTGFDESKVASVSGSTVNFSTATARPHPQVNGQWNPEVMNLTRNVMIQGQPGHRTHIFIRSTKPQQINYVAIRWIGPRQATGVGNETDFVKGRYGVHFHHSMDGSRGSQVIGTVIRDAGSHGYVAHDSHGILFKDDVAYSGNEDAYWWDDNVGNQPNGPESNDIVFDHDIAAKLHDPDNNGIRLSGFNLMQGLRNTIRNSTAVGIDGDSGSSGIQWPESNGPHGYGLWNAYEGNVTHNNHVDGIFIWQNTSAHHQIANTTVYNNGNAGLEIGAYVNEYYLVHNNFYGNTVGIKFHSQSHTAGSAPQNATIMNNTINNAGMGAYGIEFKNHQIKSDIPIYVANNNISGYTDYAFAWTGGGAGVQPDTEDLINNTVSGNKYFVNCNTHGFNQVRAQDSSGALRLTIASPCNSSANNIVQTSISSFLYNLADNHEPNITITSPFMGQVVAGVQNVSVSGYDYKGITSYDLMLDDARVDFSAGSGAGLSFDASKLSPGIHSLQLKAYDAAKNVGTSGYIYFFVGSSPF